MSRFLGILLMLTTGSVLVELVAAGSLDPVATALTLGLAFLVIGFLLGMLATARQWLWAILGSAAVVIPQVLSGRIRFPLPDQDAVRPWIFLLVPPVALVLGTLVGAGILRRRSEAQIKPEHDE